MRLGGLCFWTYGGVLRHRCCNALLALRDIAFRSQAYSLEIERLETRQLACYKPICIQTSLLQGCDRCPMEHCRFSNRD